MRVLLTTINQLFSYLSQRQDSNLTKSLPLPQLYLHILFIILIFVVRNKNIFIHFKIDNNMVNLYKLTNLLEAGMTIFQLNQWKNEGIWYPITQYKKPSNEIEIVTNLFIPIDTEIQRYHIQLTANYDASEMDEWKRFLEDNQWKLYPLLKNIMDVFLPHSDYGYRILYTLYPEGFISVLAEELPAEPYIPLNQQIKSEED